MNDTAAATLMTFFILTEYTKRYKIFVDNMKKIQLLNENERGTATYGPNKFSDLTGIHTLISYVFFIEVSPSQGPRGPGLGVVITNAIAKRYRGNVKLKPKTQSVKSEQAFTKHANCSVMIKNTIVPICLARTLIWFGMRTNFLAK